MNLQGAAFLLATLYWAVTAFYGVLTSQAFIQEQFLAPRLFPPLALFADWHAAIGGVVLMPWIAVRLLRERGARTFAAIAVCAGGLTLIALAAPLSGMQTATTSWTVTGVGVAAMIALAVAEWTPMRPGMPAFSAASGMDDLVEYGVPPRDRSLADLAACLVAACSAAAAQSAATLLSNGTSGFGAAALADAGRSFRLHLLLGAAAFLSLVVVRAVAEFCGRRRVAAERVLTGLLIAAVFAAFLHFVVLASLSIRGGTAVAMAAALGLAVALAVIARGGNDGAASDDGVRAALASLTPRLVTHVWGIAVWVVALGALAAAVGFASRTTDWNFVLARTGVMIVWLLALAGGIAVTRRITVGGTHLALAVAGAILFAHVSMPVAKLAQSASTVDHGARWLGEILDRPAHPVAGAGIVGLLHARTNIPRGSVVEPVDVNLAPLAGEPAVQRPHIFVFVVDSLRRDYLSPYNAKVSFTPSIAALADDSLVFRNAFTQYGATGLSIPSLWVGGPILHKQYVTPFAPMNSLAKLLAHERYTQWIGMDNIMDVILPASDRRERLDPNVAVKDFRMCNTLAGIRTRLADGTPEAPLFVYSLPQDVHVSVITREGAKSIDQGGYDGFYAPVASRVARLDACLGEFVSDLKARGLYDQSIIVITSDHGDSLGEEGRMGHAYTLHPEIVRVPLIVHVPPALRSQWSWDEQRAAFTTDITPTLYRLLGHQTQAPAEFFGEPLAYPIGSTPPAPRDRMVAASYGAVYGALLDGGKRYYVFDAIAMRELAFSMDEGAAPGTAIEVTREIQQRGLNVIRRTVDDISRFYRYPRETDAARVARR
jgi:glucan phosphoethanolaminetransferase (alkaline phosphatase superfamily)